MALNPSKAVILIPSLEPDDRLPAYAAQLRESGFEQIVVVDDGSSAATQPIFERIDAMEGCKVLHHDVNHGKGVALKTGYKWIEENCPDCVGVITADADGQHAVEDCIRLAEKLCEGKRALYLGSRDFSQPDVPPRSRTGNRITSVVFKLLYGQWLQDTQTGLRAFLKQDLPFMINVEGERYEYEMKVLIACARAGIPMLPITIKTIYENDNAGSHFHPVRDSIRIYKVILGSFIKFMGASLASFVLDEALFTLLLNVVLAPLGLAKEALIWISGLAARLVSSVFNFSMNRSFVFKLKGSVKKAVPRYVVLCVAIICLSNAGVTLLNWLGMNATVAKIICDTLLYFLSYRVQNGWVFREEEA